MGGATGAALAGDRVMAGLSLAIVEIARREGVDLGDVLRGHGIDEESLAPSDAYVPVALHERLWEEAARRTGRPDFSLVAAERFGPGLTGVVEYVLRNCATIGDAAATWIRLAAAVSDRIHGELVDDAGVMRLVWRLDRPPSRGAALWAEFAQARTLGLAREVLASPDLAPSEVWFRHAAPADATHHRAFFRAPVLFDRPENALLLPKALLDRPLKWVDADARRALEERAERLVRELAEPASLVARVEAALLALLREPGADLRLERVAERIGLRPRTLQARLRAEGQAFRDVVERVRVDEARRVSAAGGVTQRELARRLGYADASALRRSMRRWSR
jgi:AraC-like DNA-binding protein